MSATAQGKAVNHVTATLHERAMLSAMQGILAGLWSNNEIGGVSPKMVIDEARQHADEFMRNISEGGS